MKEGITSLDLMFILKELKEELIESKIQKVRQIGRIISLELYKNKKFFLKVLPNAIYITIKTETVEMPPDFCMLLRKHLTGKTITDIKQHKFDRIVEMDVNGYKLIIELFSNGNVILLDEMNSIIGILETQRWKDRILKIGEKYRYPPAGINPFTYSFIDFQRNLKTNEKEIGKVLAINFGLGGIYTEEFCKRLKIDKNKLAYKLEQFEIDKLFRLFEEIKNAEVKPMAILDGNKQTDVVPFEMGIYADKNKKEFANFNSAVENYFENLEKIQEKKEEVEKELKEGGRLAKIKEKQEIQLKQLKQIQEKYEKSAKLLYKNYADFTKILTQIKDLKEKKKNWEEIELVVKQNPEVKEIEPKEALVVVEAEGMEIDLDFRKNVKEIANEYFERAKKAKKKIISLEKVMEKFEVKPMEKPTETQWYEKYRWFISSDGILVIAGRDAKQNEEIIKTQSRPYDIVFHADIHGAPFTVIRNDARKIPKQTIKEAAEFAASYSRAWKERTTVDVYYIAPDQVVKTAGLPTGSFMIRGNRKWVEKIEPKIALGVKEGKLLVGPVESVKKQVTIFVTIVPGDKTADELAKEIKKYLKASDEEIKRSIPYGKGELSK